MPADSLTPTRTLPELSSDDLDQILNRVLSLLKYRAAQRLLPHSPSTSDGRFMLDEGLRRGNAPPDALGNNDIGIMWLFEDDEDLTDLAGTDEILKRCVGIEFYSTGYYDGRDEDIWSIVYDHQSPGEWRLNEEQTTTSKQEAETFLAVMGLH